MFRAKKINSDENVVGMLSPCGQFILAGGVIGFQLIMDKKSYNYETIPIDQSTLTIEVPELTDKDGASIYASLCKSGKGGDRLLASPYTTEWVVKFGKYYEAPFDSKGDKLNRYGIYVESKDGERRNINDLFTIMNVDHQQVETIERVRVIGVQK